MNIPVKYNNEIIGYIDNIEKNNKEAIGTIRINPDKVELINNLINQCHPLHISSRGLTSNEIIEPKAMDPPLYYSDMLYNNYKDKFHNLSYSEREQNGMWRGEYEFNSGYPNYETLTKEEFLNRYDNDKEFYKKWKVYI